MRALLCSGAVLATLALSGPVRATHAPDGGAVAFRDIFTNTCLAAFSDPQKVEQFMESHGLAPLHGETANKFLHGKAGKAWSIALDGANYAVAQTADGVCSVFAQQAQPDAVTAEFQRLLLSMPAPLEVAEVQNSGPTGNGTRTRSWGVDAPGLPNGILFTLTTSTDAGMPLQAMASMARVASNEFKQLAAP